MSAQSRENKRLKLGDTVVVIGGGHSEKRPNKGQVGKIKAFVGSDRVIVEGINFVTRRKRPQQGGTGTIERKEGSIHLSNVMYYSEQLKKGVRLKVREEGGQKERGYLDPQSKAFVKI